MTITKIASKKARASLKLMSDLELYREHARACVNFSTWKKLGNPRQANEYGTWALAIQREQMKRATND